MPRRFALIALCACGRIEFDAIDGTADDAADGATADVFINPACIGFGMPVPASGAINGSLVDGGSQHAGTCGGNGVSELIYAIDVPAGGELVVAGDGPTSGADCVFYMRSDCMDTASEVICDIGDGIGNFPAQRMIGLAAGRYYVFFDSDPGKTGVVDGEIFVGGPLGSSCTGDTTRDRCAPDLQCVGNQCVDAGCSVTETLPSTGTINRMPVTATGTPSRHAGRCGQGADGGVRAPETIYRVSLASPITSLRVSTASAMTTFDTIVYVRAGCSGMQVGCDDDGGASVQALTSDLTVGPLAAGDYFIFVDGFSRNTGTAAVSITITP